MKFFRKNKKAFASLLLISLFNQLLLPAVALANNGGDISSEYGKGGGVGNDLVNMYNGAFNYKVDLLTLPGAGVSFPLNISYNSSDVNMLSVPTSVGEGWSLNIPKITRQVNAIPDDYKGDLIKYNYDQKPFEELMIDISDKSAVEYFGFPDPSSSDKNEDKSANLIIKVGGDNYSGFRYVLGARLKSKKLRAESTLSYKVGITYILDSKYGPSINPSVDLFKGDSKLGSLSLNGSVRNGYQGMSITSSVFNFNYINSGTPLVEMPTETNTYSINGKLGSFNSLLTKFQAVNSWLGEGKPKIRMIDAHYTETKLKEKEFFRPGVGLLYKKFEQKLSVKDYTRNSSLVNKDVPFLPTSQIGKDIFIQSGGYGGVFTVDDPNVRAYSTTFNSSSIRNTGIGLEAAKRWQVGVDFLSNKGTSSSGSWESADFDNKDLLTNNQSQKLKASEVSIMGRDNIYTTWKGTAPVAPVIQKEGQWGSSQRGFNFKNKFLLRSDDISDKKVTSDVDVNSTHFGVNNNNRKLKYVQYLTTKEAYDYGYTKGSSYLERYGTDETRAHHIAEIHTFERDNAHLVYGEPVYTFKKVDATFSLDTKAGSSQNRDDALHLNEYDFFEYDDQVDGEIVGAGAVGSEMLKRVETPAYATSWLVSKIPSNDYEDVTGDGVTNDDLGDCVSFEYWTRESDSRYTNQVYKFRNPYEGVDVNQGVKGYPRDNTGSYSYGEREIKYPKVIETKTHYVEFVYDQNLYQYRNINPSEFRSEKRKDGHQVKNEKDGGILYEDGELNASASSKPFSNTWRLIEMRLYKKNPDGSRKENKNDFIQKVVLEHDYSLKKNHPSNFNSINEGGYENSGVLTLKKVYSTYRYSKKGEIYSYRFSYNESSTKENPDYDRMNTDGWGDFYDNKMNYENYPYKDLPYCEQTFNSAGEWLLKGINLPSGAELQINYEKNDYSYVQDKEATQFYDIVGTKNFDSYDDNDDLSTNANRNNLTLSRVGASDSYNNVIIELDADLFSTDMSPDDMNTEFFEKYLKDLDNELLVSAYVKLTPDAQNSLERGYDWVDVIAQYDSYRVEKKTTGSQVKYFGIINLKSKYMAGAAGKSHPLKVASFEKLKQNRPDLVYGQPQPFGNASTLIGTGALISVLEMFGPSSVLNTGGFAQKIRLNGWSKIRLKNPSKSKKGGGYRVESITLKDKWVNKVEDNYNYVLKYDYGFYDELTNEKIRSSGVATEPFQIRKESANWDLITYKKRLGWLFEPHLVQIQGNPLDLLANEGPSIGYEMISVRTELPSDVTGGNEMSKPPYQRYEFYSKKSHPTIKRHTDLYVGNKINFPLNIEGYLDINYEEKAYSQGYTVVTNDMAGKLKSLRTFDRENELINGQLYFYKEEDDRTNVIKEKKENLLRSEFGTDNTVKVKSLNNEVVLIGEDRKLSKGFLGVSQEIWMDQHENKTRSKSDWYQFNLNVYKLPEGSFAPFFVTPLMVLPIRDHKVSEKTIVMNKKIHKSGILDRVVTVKDESKIVSKYIAYDKLTGKVVLSSVQNEFGDDIYKYSHSAYHEYEGMKPVEESIDVELFNIDIDENGALGLSDGLLNGDLVVFQLEGDQNWLKGYVLEDGTNKKILPFSDDAFSALSGDDPLTSISIDHLRVLKSGNSNLVDASVGEITAQKLWVNNYNNEVIDLANLNEINDISDGVSKLLFENGDDQQVLNASAITFKSEWNKNCCSGLDNPFRNGQLNNWRPYQSFVYNGDRDYNSGILNRTRNSGRLLSFHPFTWSANSNNNSEWVLSSQATYYDKNGNLLEQKDALGLYSASGYGYGGNLVSFVSGNSPFNWSGFDGFEDYDFFQSCFQNYGFTFYADSESRSRISSQESHSGKYSIVLLPGESVKMKVVVGGCSN